MGKKDPRIDEYISKSADFAQPVLSHFRKMVHKACPDVEETMKWSFPHFDYKGMMCSMASFKSHCAINFWKSSLVLGDDAKDGAMGQLGRIASLSDLPADKQLLAYIKKAAALNDSGTRVERPVKRAATKEVTVPEDLQAALKKNRKAFATFQGFSPSHKREYVQWIIQAKTDATRERRLAQAIEWMSEGKNRHWKYVKA